MQGYVLLGLGSDTLSCRLQGYENIGHENMDAQQVVLFLGPERALYPRSICSNPCFCLIRVTGLSERATFFRQLNMPRLLMQHCVGFFTRVVSAPHLPPRAPISPASSVMRRTENRTSSTLAKNRMK